MKIKTASIDSVIIYFKDEISEEVLDQVLSANEALKSLKHIIDITPSYSSILIHYDTNFYNESEIKQTIDQLLQSHQQNSVTKSAKTIEIPVDYSKGLDLQRVAEFNNLSVDEVIKLHTSITYRVYAIGFMVGFAYLAKVDDSIVTPRLDTPRAKVAKGSVAIADNQTAVYPSDSAGGWNILGLTEFDEFDSFKVGDSVRFVAI
ncbi:MAG: allophanate hydrolase subunit 1 [Sulfurimonas sp.]